MAHQRTSPAGNQTHVVRKAFDIAGLLGSLFLAWYLWPAALGGSMNLVVVQGHSMEPTYQLGDAVIVKDNADLQVGDIIVFRIPADEPGGGMEVIHRIHSVREDGSFETQGDNRDTPDSFHITEADVIGTPTYAIPRLGRFIGLSSRPLVLGLAIGAMTTMVLWPERRRRRQHELDPVAWLRTELAAIEERASAEDLVAEAEAWLEDELAFLGVSG